MTTDAPAAPATAPLTADEIERLDHAVTVALGTVVLGDLMTIAEDLRTLWPRASSELVDLRSGIRQEIEEKVAGKFITHVNDLTTERDGYRSMLADVMAASPTDDVIRERARTVLKHGVLGPKRFFHVDDGGATYTMVARDQEHAKSLLRDVGVEFTDESGDSAPIDDPRFADLEWKELSLEQAQKRIVSLGDSGAGPKAPLAECTIGDFFTSEI